jgi:cephalosporin-C deacetylase-like acetyl esterase
MRSITELLQRPPRADMVPDFTVSEVARLGALREADPPPMAKTRAALRRSLGVDRLPRSAYFEEVEAFEADHIRVEKVVFESVPGMRVPALVYVPEGDGPFPALVHAPGHWMEDGKLASPLQITNEVLARNGITVLCYDTLGQGERRTGWHQHGQLAPLLVGFTSLGVMVRDSLRALDILESRSDVDPSRIGLFGASGGGFSSIFASAIDERVAVAAICCIVNTHESQVRDAGYGTGWDSWVDLCNQVPHLAAIGPMSAILGCVAPRNLLVANAIEDPGFPIAGAREVATGTRRSFHSSGADVAFSYKEVSGGHGFTPAMRRALFDYVVPLLTGSRPQVGEPEKPAFAPQWEVPHNRGSASTPQTTKAGPSRGTCLAEPVDSNAPLVQIAQDLAREQAARRGVPHRSDIADALGPLPSHGPLNWHVENHITLDGFHAQRLTIASEPGVTLDSLFLLPRNWTDDLCPVLVVLDEGGKGAALDSDVARAAVDAGNAVFLPDLRGTGESAVSEFEVATAAWMTDRDLLNQRVWDVLRVIEYLSTRYSSAQQIDKSRIVLWGEATFSLVALVAACLDDRIAAVGGTGFASLEEALTVDVSVSPMLYHFDLLSTADLDDLAAVIAPRPVRYGVGPENAPTAALELIKELA